MEKHTKETEGTVTSVSMAAVRRSTWVCIGIFAVFGILLLRILLIQTVNFDKYQAKVLNQITTESPIPADRGKIYDRNGNVLATNITTYRVFVSPSGIKSAQEDLEEGDTTDYADLISEGLSQLLGVKYETVHTQITEYTRYLDRTIQRKVDEETADLVQEFINEHKLTTMVYLEAQSTRYYPGGTLAAHMLGFTSTDGDGLYGLEYQYDEYLSGVDGYYIKARDSYGNEMPMDYASMIEAVDGYNLQTTIDTTIQNFLEEQLERTVTDHAAVNRACGIVMEVKTGAILAMATSSPFNLNDPWQLDDISADTLANSGYEAGTDAYADLQRKLLTEMWSNKAVTESYIPGSTFKIITSAMALEENEAGVKALEALPLSCSGHKDVLGHTIHCHKLQGHGVLSFAEGLQQSCNVWFMSLGELIGVDTYQQYVKAFGYKEKTGIDLPGEGNSIFASEMSALDLAIYAFGQNFNVTPLQQLCAISAVANNGALMTPYIVEKITDNAGNVIWQHEAETKRTVVSEKVCKQISEILEEGVAGNGGAKNAYVAGYRVAAKTGTSEKKNTGHTTYKLPDFTKLTVEDAKKVIEEDGLRCVVVGNSANGAMVSAQSPSAGTSIVLEGGTVVLYSGETASAFTEVPSLYGLSLEQAKRLLSEAGLNLSIEGTAIHSAITDQSLSAGSSAEQGSVVTLTFSEAYICSTVAYAPAEDPEIAIIIIVDEPTKGSLYGSTVAAPYIAAALENILPYWGVERDPSVSGAVAVGNYRNMTLAEAKAAITGSGLKYTVIGTDDPNAIVNRQTPSGGVKVEKDSGRVILYVGEDAETEQVEVPNVIGKNAEVANGLLIGSKLNIRIVGSPDTGSREDWVVVSQSVSAGTKVAIGTVITLTFGAPDENPDYESEMG